MSRLKIIMIVSTTNNIRPTFYPMDSPQDLLNEILEVANRMKTVINKGIIETRLNKFTYQQYIPSEEDDEGEEQIEKTENLDIPDRPVIFICSDKSYKDIKLEKVFNEINEILNEVNQKNSKISQQTKSKIGKIFLKYQNMNEIRECDNKEIEFGTIEEMTGFNMKSVSNSTICDMTDTISDAKRRSKLRDMEKKKKEEIENVKRWRKIKIVYLFISIILLMLTIGSIVFSFIK